MDVVLKFPPPCLHAVFCNHIHLIIKQNIGLAIIVITYDFVSCLPIEMVKKRLICPKIVIFGQIKENEVYL
jgi:hypothetical protein